MKKTFNIIYIIALTLLMSVTVAESKDIIKLGENINVEEGIQAGMVVAIGGDAVINGIVDEDVVAIGGSVKLGEKAIVNGKVISIGGSVSKESGAKVNGKIIEKNSADMTTIIRSIPSKQAKGFFQIIKLLCLIGFISLSLLIVSLMPNQVGKVSSCIERDPFKAFLWSILGVLLIIPIALALIMSIVGILLIPLEIFLVICSFIFAYIAIAQLVGKKLAAFFKKRNLPILLETTFGILVLSLVGRIPFIGVLLIMIATLLGFGGIISSIIKK